MNKDKFSFYKEHPKTCATNDFWGQVKRTVNGTPVSQDQIDMIVNSVVVGLQLERNDVLLDLCCGNGALSTLFFQHCKGGLGVDFSEYLISVAHKYFAKLPMESYLLQDVVEFCFKPVDSEKFTKSVCYGSFPFLEQERAVLMLQLLRSNFPNLKRVFIGNCPDKSHLHAFFGERYTLGIENEPDSPIGIWRTQEEFIAMANACGWQAKINVMPSSYYAAHYRYDVILSNE